MSEIKPAEEKFLQGLMLGKTQYQAYLDAFPQAQSWKRKVVDNKASELLRRGEIQVRYNELQIQAREVNQISRDWVISTLKAFASAPLDLDKLRPADQLKALDMLCHLTKMYPDPDSED